MGFWDKLAHGVVLKGVAEKKEDAVPDTSLGEKDGFYSPNTLLKQNALNDYMNRDPFNYDFNADALYQQYKDKYIQQGKMAMQDTMGQAAAMTGGYGNSYAQSVGQQAYAAQLQNLNDVVPELYQMALDNYNREGEEMLNKYALYNAEEQKDYERYWTEQEWDRLYGEEEVEEEAPTYPDWYQEGDNEYANLYRYLGLEGDPIVDGKFVKAAMEMTGIENGNEAVEAAIQMMNRELNYGSVDLSDTNVANQLKALKSPSEISTYLDLLEGRGIISPATADYYKSIYSVSSEGKTDADNVADTLDDLVNKGLLDPDVADEWYDEYMKEQEK